MDNLPGNTPAPTLYNYEDGLLSNFDKGDYTLEEDVGKLLPTSKSAVSEERGNFLTDWFNTAVNWVRDKTGINYFLSFVNAIPNLLKHPGLGLPPPIAYSLGVIWHVMIVILVIMWVKS